MADTRKAAKAFTENAFETTLSAVFNSTDVQLTVNSTGDLAGSGPVYIVINPDDAAKREYIFIDGTITATTMTTSTVDNRFLAGSAADSGIDHSSGDRVRISPMSQHFDDVWNAIGKVVDVDYDSATAESIKFAGPVDVNNQVLSNVPDPTNPQEPATKAYVDAKDIDDDLSISDGNTGTQVDLDTETLTIQGTANEIDVNLTDETFTISQPTNVTIGNELTVTGQILAQNGMQTDSLTERNSGAGITINSDIELAAGVSATGFGGGVTNEFINGSFNIWQRGTSFTGSKFTSDRWYVNNGGSGTITTTRETHGVAETGVPGMPKYFLKMAKTASNRFTTSDYLLQRIENVRKFGNSTKWTVSFYAKASESNMTVTPELVYDFGSSGSASTTATQSSISTTTGWARYSFTFTGASLSGKTISSGSSYYDNDYLEVRFKITSSSGTANNISFSDIQIESGETANNYQVESAGIELKKCQRYYQLLIDGSAGTRVPIGIGFYSSADIIDGMAEVKEDMRGPRTITTTSGSGHYQSTAGGIITDNFSNLSVNLVDTNNFNNRAFGIFHNGSNSGDLANQAVSTSVTITANSSSTKITIEAEL